MAITVTDKVRAFLKERKQASIREIKAALQLEHAPAQSIVSHLSKMGEIRYENGTHHYVRDYVAKPRKDKGTRRPFKGDTYVNQIRQLLVERGIAPISEIIANVGRPYATVYATLYALAKRGEVLRGSDGKWMVIPQQAAPVSWEAVVETDGSVRFHTDKLSGDIYAVQVDGSVLDANENPVTTPPDGLVDRAQSIRDKVAAGLVPLTNEQKGLLLRFACARDRMWQAFDQAREAIPELADNADHWNWAELYRLEGIEAPFAYWRRMTRAQRLELEEKQ